MNTLLTLAYGFVCWIILRSARKRFKKRFFDGVELWVPENFVNILERTLSRLKEVDSHSYKTIVSNITCICAAEAHVRFGYFSKCVFINENIDLNPSSTCYESRAIWPELAGWILASAILCQGHKEGRRPWANPQFREDAHAQGIRVKLLLESDDECVKQPISKEYFS